LGSANEFQRIPNKGLGWDTLLSRHTKFIPKSEQIPEQLAPLKSTPPLYKFKYENVNTNKKNRMFYYVDE
jgi:hypothetical protein